MIDDRIIGNMFFVIYIITYIYCVLKLYII